MNVREFVLSVIGRQRDLWQESYEREYEDPDGVWGGFYDELCLFCDLTEAVEKRDMPRAVTVIETMGRDAVDGLLREFVRAAMGAEA